MILKRLFPAVFVITLMACQKTGKTKQLNVSEEIAGLENISDREKYLESIQDSDQSWRDSKGSEIVLEYGKDSREYQQFLSKRDSIDQLNFKRIRLYLKEFGYPDADSVSGNASVAPWLVIQHMTDVEDRKEYFPYFNRAYKERNIEPNQFEMYLGRIYQFQFGEYPAWEGKYVADEKIQWLIEELHLEEDEAGQ